jgi:hypothetical protein
MQKKDENRKKKVLIAIVKKKEMRRAKNEYHFNQPYYIAYQLKKSRSLPYRISTVVS